MTEILKKGENISLSKISPQLNEIIVAVKWLKKADDIVDYEIDSSAFMLTEENKVRNDADFIFYNQPNSPDNSVVLKNSLFKINLNSIPSDIYRLSFVLTLHEGKQKQQHFGMLDKVIIETFNFADKQKLVSYTLDDMGTETALVLGFIYRYNSDWKFRALGQGYNDGLSVLARNFGVDIKETLVQANASQSSSSQESKITSEQNTEANTERLVNKSENNSQSKSKKKHNKNPSDKKIEPKTVDIHNTDIMTKEDHYQPIVDWFQNKNFAVEVNPNAMDTSGFFDEVAVELGDNYDLLKIVSNTIKRRQTDKRTAYINFANYNYSQKETERIKQFCKHLYEYSFVAKYLFNKEENKIILHLQSAVKIVNFFNGEWLEWYAFMKIASFCYQRKIDFSCTRNIVISLPDSSKYELDVFCLVNGMPLFIECKSGEYRGFIDKYSRLRRKMLIDKPCFLFLVLGEADEHVKGLTAMFELTFINEKMLAEYCEDVFVKKNI
jgi:stress response protein SCP2